MSACLVSPAMQVSRQTCHRLMPKASKGLLQYGSGLQQNHNHTHNRDSRNDSRTNNDQHHTYNDSSNNSTIRTNSGTTVIVVVVVVIMLIARITITAITTSVNTRVKLSQHMITITTVGISYA